MTAAAGVGAILDEEYFKENVRIIRENRAYLTQELSELGFDVLPSAANFIFAKKEGISGKEYYLSLKEKGVLVRYFDKARLKDYVRITVGTKEEIDILVAATKEILEGRV